MTASTLLWGVLFGSIGVGYMMYGKRRKRNGAFYAGLGLLVYPYLVTGTWLVPLVGVALVLVPFFYRD